MGVIHGSCLCGAITFRLDAPLRAARYCHCRNCRKFAGTSPAAWAMADASKLLVTSSNGQIGRFNSGRGVRCFCSLCGSPVWFESIDHPEIVGIPLGAIDEGKHGAPEMHLWVTSKPDWYEILDDLVQHERGPE